MEDDYDATDCDGHGTHVAASAIGLQARRTPRHCRRRRRRRGPVCPFHCRPLCGRRGPTPAAAIKPGACGAHPCLPCAALGQHQRLPRTVQVGVAKEAEVVAVRILDCTGSGTISDTVAGLVSGAGAVAGGEAGQPGGGLGCPACHTACGLAHTACGLAGPGQSPAGRRGSLSDRRMQLSSACSAEHRSRPTCSPPPLPRPPPPAQDWVAANHRKPAVVTLSLGIQVGAAGSLRGQPWDPPAASRCARGGSGAAGPFLRNRRCSPAACPPACRPVPQVGSWSRVLEDAVRSLINDHGVTVSEWTVQREAACR